MAQRTALGVWFVANTSDHQCGVHFTSSFLSGRCNIRPGAVRRQLVRQTQERKCRVQAVPMQTSNASAQEEASISSSFDVATAIALAGCAFESYNEPVGVAEGYQEWSINGTYTTYVDREFIKETLAGMLEVHLKSATGLPARDLWGSSDPYAVVTVGESAGRSRVIDRNLNPVWDEKFQLYVRDPEKQRLIIKVLDKDMFTADDSLGFTLLPVSKLVDGSTHNLDLLLDGAGSGGQIQLSITFFPFTDEVAETVEAEMGAPAKGSAVEGITSGAWRALAEICGKTAEELYDPLCYIDNTITDTQVWVFRNASLRCMCIAFRGTEQVKWKDLVTDLSFQPAAFNPERVLESSSSRSLLASAAEDVGGRDDWTKLAQKTFELFMGSGKELSASEEQEVEKAANAEPWVHEGFLRAYDSVRTRVLGVVDEVLTGSEDSWHVYVTGHSLGGALATLCSFELANRRYRHGGEPEITMYNYGSPRVGNAAFARAYDRSVPDSWRVTNRLDVIPRVPRLMGYCHVGNSVSVTPDGRFEVNDKKVDVFKEGHMAEDVLPVLAQRALRAAQERSEDDTAEIAALIEHEMNFMQTLVTGSALSEHMEDFYLDTLRALATTDTSVAVAGIVAEVTQSSVDLKA
ncbi:g11139 [Coccomyxa elongata]